MTFQNSLIKQQRFWVKLPKMTFFLENAFVNVSRSLNDNLTKDYSLVSQKWKLNFRIKSFDSLKYICLDTYRSNNLPNSQSSAISSAILKNSSTLTFAIIFILYLTIRFFHLPPLSLSFQIIQQLKLFAPK